MSGPAALSPLSAAERALLQRGLAQFNARRYFDCHDTLEELWRGLRDERRDFVQGLIQLAVAFHHLGNGNRPGAVRLFDRGLERLRAYPAVYEGLQTGSLREAAGRWRHAAAAGDTLPDEAPPLIAHV